VRPDDVVALISGRAANAIERDRLLDQLIGARESEW